MTAPSYPKRASDFLRLIERAGDLDQWDIACVESEWGDPGRTRVIFFLRDDDWRRAYVAHEFGRLIVTVNGSYHFDLDRLHENGPDYTWITHLSEKIWFTAAHRELIERLYRLFTATVPNDRKVRAARGAA